ncbi:hypothetical protein ACRALDRAFT_205522 [Sodiomyces alcalophilus JCM 7366]|uniref:uncharacterized protein n=1 Tax=Sodiomyces alcalophilus JCM 7366 TaxID=591952 RepID=UPI0039B51EDB
MSSKEPSPTILRLFNLGAAPTVFSDPSMNTTNSRPRVYHYYSQHLDSHRRKLPLNSLGGKYEKQRTGQKFVNAIVQSAVSIPGIQSSLPLKPR